MDGLFEMEKKKTDIVTEKGEIRVKCLTCLPRFKGEDVFARRANAFYDGIYERFRAFNCTKLLKKAQKTPLNAKPFGAVLNARVTFVNEKYVSVIMDAHVFDGVRRGRTVRVSQVWNRRDGETESVNAFVPPRARCAVLDDICAQAEERYSAGAAFYRPDPINRIKNSFCPRNFYLLPEGVAFFFEAGAVSQSDTPEVFVVKDINMSQ